MRKVSILRNSKHPSVSKTRVITVTGIGELQVAPNYAELRIEVVTQAMDISEAQNENARLINQVIQALLEINIDREDIQTASYNIYPRYDYIEGKQVFRGYEVSNAITVKVVDISQVGRVIDVAVKNGANRISSVEFKLANESNYYHQALQIAFMNAVAKANTLAQTMKLPYYPEPIEITEESEESPPVMFRVASVSTQETYQTPIEQGLITISARLNVKFKY